MHRTVGLLYIATGLLCDFADMLIAGAMLGMTTPIYSVSSLIIPPLLGTGQALLVLTGALRDNNRGHPPQRRMPDHRYCSISWPGVVDHPENWLASIGLAIPGARSGFVSNCQFDFTCDQETLDRGSDWHCYFSTRLCFRHRIFDLRSFVRQGRAFIDGDLDRGANYYAYG